MKLFKLQPDIYKFDKFSDFAAEFKLNNKDIIVVNDSIFNSFIKHLNLDCLCISPKKYGTGEPSDEIIDNVIKEAAQYDYERVIAIGGGAVMDIAKFLALDNIKIALDVFERRAPFHKVKQLIAIPTTCGTGSEVTNYSVAEIKSKGTKMGIGIDEFYPDQAVLIPEVMKDMPYKFFAFSSLDALVHAAESLVAPGSNPYTELYAEKAIELILSGYKQIAEKGQEYYSTIIEDFLIGSNYAGIAFGNTGVGAVHALSYPLGGIYHVAHGECNYEFFTPVFKTYAKRDPHGKINVFNKLVTSVLELPNDADIYIELDNLLNAVWDKQPLNRLGMKPEDILEFTESVIEKQQRLLSNSYVALSKQEIMDIYQSLY